MNKYHPEFDDPNTYRQAAENASAETKALLIRAAMSIEYLQKYQRGVANLLASISNDIVYAIQNEEMLEAQDLEHYLPRMARAIETADDDKCEFSLPYEQWKDL